VDRRTDKLQKVVKKLKDLGLKRTDTVCRQWRIQGARPLYFWQSQFSSFTLYTMSENNIFEIEFGFIVVEIRKVSGSVGVYACVCVNRNRGRYCFLSSKGPILNDIRGHSDPKNICQIA